MDATGAGDGPVEIVQKSRKVHMAIQYTTGNNVVEDTSFPFGTAKAMRVGKSYLINNAQNYMDDHIVQFYKYTNKDLLLETDAIMEKRTTS